ncbi:hypothetical protein ARMSODRAFT_1013208 [Armillaria solidipes]|uniref:Uncharacterized protein n=1 Tax=Armillaria solidipes TaxID=1076256 RepID=A0A2H3C960_9AGAR|nr:hypothetical protein ARMSODRAFT_1013208 [Armillaria solidipes]
MPRRRRDSESDTVLSTESSSPPVSRDGFFYDGHGLFVEVDSNRHYREDSDALYALLTHVDPPPVYTKSGTLAKRQPPPFKDRPGHFYRAQLVHYGLNPVTVKEAAKGLLLSAFDRDNTLAVPNKILRLEADLKAKFEQKDKVTEAGGNKKAVSDSFVRNKKLKQAPDQELFEEIMALGPDVALPNPDTITVEEVLEEVVKMSNDRVAATLSTSVDPEEVLDILPDIMDRYKIKTKTSEEDREEEEILQTRREIADQVADLPEQQLTNVIRDLMEDSERLEELLKLEGARSQLEMRDSASHQSSSKAKPKHIRNDAAIQVAGKYAIIAPKIEKEYPVEVRGASYKMALKLCASKKTPQLWGKFDFGVFEGILRSNGPVSLRADEAVSFSWRARETGEGDITGDEDSFDVARIVFLSGGKLKGTIHSGLGRFDFVGTRDDNNTKAVPTNSAEEWKEEWKTLVRW